MLLCRRTVKRIPLLRDKIKQSVMADLKLWLAQYVTSRLPL